MSRDQHWLIFTTHAKPRICGCQCGFNADDSFGDSVVSHLLATGWDEGYAAGCDDERESMPDHTPNPHTPAAAIREQLRKVGGA